MTTIIDAWVVCAPGDPSDAQWRAIRELSNGATSFCATRFNERSGWVRIEIERPNQSTDHYSISPDGRDCRFIRTEEAPCHP